jgi:hypothetical protein
MQNLPDVREAEARRTSLTADLTPTVAALGYSKQNDDAEIAALLQSGMYKSNKSLAAKLRVGPKNARLSSSLARVLAAKNVTSIREHIALGANKKQKRR